MRSFLMILCGVLVASCTLYGCASPLIKAVAEGDTRTAEQLIQEGTLLDDTSGTYGQSALIIAAKNGNLRIVRKLLQAGADVNLQTKDHITALVVAAWNCHSEIVGLLLNHGADPNVPGSDYWFAPLSGAVECNDIASAGMLLSKGAIPRSSSQNRYADSPLALAAEKGYLGMVNLLLYHGVDVNTKGRFGQTALYRAAKNGDVQTVKMLLDRSADVNIKVFESDCEAQLSRKTCALFRLDPVPNWTPLMIAAAMGNSNIVTLLLDKGADSNAMNYYGMTALLFAAGNGHAGIVESLLQKGADPNVVPIESYGNPALVTAVIRNYRPVVETLLRNGADINVRTRYGKTALDSAKMNGRGEMQALLKYYGAKEEEN